jgi:hypothetical protein
VLAGARAGDTQDRNLAWGRWTLPSYVSRDGQTALVSGMDNADADYMVMLRRFDGSAPVRLGQGRAHGLSPDGKWALSITPATPQQVLLLPAGAGETRQVDIGDLLPNAATFVPPGLTVAVAGVRGGAPAALVVDVLAGTRTTIDLPELAGRAFSLRRILPLHASPDGALLAAQTDDGAVLAWALRGGGRARELAKLAESESFVGWSSEPSRIYLAAWSGSRARIDALDIGTGRRTSIREIVVADPAGMLMVPDLYLSADAKTYMYGFARILGTLYVVTGLR